MKFGTCSNRGSNSNEFIVIWGAAKKYPLRLFCGFLRHRLEFQSEILPRLFSHPLHT